MSSDRISPERQANINQHLQQLDPLRKVTGALIQNQISDASDLDDADRFESVVARANLGSPEQSRELIRRLVQEARERHGGRMWEYQWNVHDACAKAFDAYARISEGDSVYATVFGRELGGKLEAWNAAHDVLAAHDTAEGLGVGDCIDVREARQTQTELAPDIVAFCSKYDAMAKGKETVSDTFPRASLFRLMPELCNEKLPDMLHRLAFKVSLSFEPELLGLFNRRWFDCEETSGGDLPGDLDLFVRYLREDADAVRGGRVFGPSRRDAGFDQRGTGPVSKYIRQSDDAATASGGWGLVPTFLQALATPVMMRDSFAAGAGVPREIPRYTPGMGLG